MTVATVTDPLRQGDVVQFMRDVDRYPFALIKAGTFGVVRDADGHVVRVRPTGRHPGLSGEWAWDGCVEWYADDDVDAPEHYGFAMLAGDVLALRPVVPQVRP